MHANAIKTVDEYPRYLVLLLTEACNLRCVYCYRGDQRCAQSMFREVAEKALHLVSSSRGRFHVQMTGGEPALEPELVEWIASLIRKKGWPATIGIQTNGTMLDTSLIRIFKQYSIQVGLSLDGPPEVQEEIRGEALSTFKGLKLLSDKEVPFRVTTVVTEQNVHALGRLGLLLGAFSTLRGIALDILVAKGRSLEGRAIHPTFQDLTGGLQRLFRALRWVNEKRSHPVKLRELELLKQAAAGKGKTSFCHAALGEAMAVLPDGSVYPCAQTAGDPRFACGTVEAVERKNAARLAAYRLQGADCTKCRIRSFCPGDCPSRLYYNDEDAKNLACVMYQALWEEYERSQK